MLSARKSPGSSIGQSAATGIGTVGVGMVQRGASGSGTAEFAGTAGAKIADISVATAGDTDTVFATATVFGIGLEALARVLSARAPSAISRAL
jgi:hypothetical protein